MPQGKKEEIIMGLFDKLKDIFDSGWSEGAAFSRDKRMGGYGTKRELDQQLDLWEDRMKGLTPEEVKEFEKGMAQGLKQGLGSIGGCPACSNQNTMEAGDKTYCGECGYRG